MVLYPVQELTKKRIQAIKDLTKLKLLEKATGGWKRPVSDFVIREVVFGDSSVKGIYDIEPGHAVADGIPQWAFDAADLTADKLSAVTKAGEEVDDQAWIAFYGFFDELGQGSESTGSAGVPVSTGPVTAVQLRRGSSTLAFWKTGHLYAYDEVVGISDTPVIFEQNEKIEIDICSTVDTDIYAGLRGYICEPLSRNFTPTYTPELRALYGVSSIPQLPLEQQKEVVCRAGIDPVQELTQEQIQRLYSKVKSTLYQMVVDEGIARDLAEAKAKYTIREFQAGDKSDAADFVDADQAAAVTTGEQEWIQAASIFTAGELTNVLASGTKVDDKKFVAIIGFADATPNSRLLEIAPADNSGNLDVWHVQHCYAYRRDIRGYTMRPTYYKQNSPLVLKMCVAVARQHRVKPIVLIAEQWGERISRT